MEVSKTLLTDLVSHLNPQDRFNLLQFSFGSKVLSESGSVPADEKHVTQALKLLNVARGSGGTEIMPALRRAFDLTRAEGMACSIVVITDGYISVEPQVFDYIRQHLGEANLFAFGIGSSVNRHLIEGMAHVGGGEPFIVTKETEAAAQTATFRRYIQSPVLTNVEFKADGFEVYDVEPPTLSDLFAERPVLCFVKWRGKRQGTMRLTGHVGDKEYRYEADLRTIEGKPEHAALRYLWARHAIMLHGDYNKLRHDQDRIAKITELGLKYSLLTDYTSFMAIDSEIRNREGQPASVKQGLPMPQGVPETARASMGKAMRAGRPGAMSPQAHYCMTGASRSPVMGIEDVSYMNFRAVEVEATADAACEFDDFGFHESAPRSLAEELDGAFRGDEEKIAVEEETCDAERHVGRKTFHLKDGVWIDDNHRSDVTLIRLQRGSEGYKALLAAIPELADYFKLGERVIVNLGAYSIEITPEGRASLTPDELKDLQAAWRNPLR